MSASAISATCNAVAIIDAAAIVGLYVHFNKRMNLIENSSSSVKSSGLSRSKASDEPLDVRVMTLENEITVLLQRLQVYDELFLKMMNRMKEINPIVDKIIDEGSPPSPQMDMSAKKTTIRRRNGTSLMARKEPFIDMDSDERLRGRGVNIVSTPTPSPMGSEDDDPDDELFSFLKD